MIIDNGISTYRKINQNMYKIKQKYDTLSMMNRDRP